MQVMGETRTTATRSASPQMSTPNLPSVVFDSAVDPADRVSAIDFIHRVNWLFDAWDIDAMVEAFLPDSVTHHTHGISRGKDPDSALLPGAVSLLVPGVSRHAPALSSTRTMTTG